MNYPLQQQIEALYLPEEKKHYDFEISRFSEGHDKGFNDCLSLTKQSLPKIIELIEKDTRERINKKITERQDLFNFIPQDKWGYKNIKTKDLDIINLINKE